MDVDLLLDQIEHTFSQHFVLQKPCPQLIHLINVK